MIHIFIATLYTYFFIIFLGRKYSAFIIIIISMLHLSYLHLTKMMYKYGNWDLSIDVLFMMTVCKFSSLAFAYEDGGKLDENIPSSYWREK